MPLLRRYFGALLAMGRNDRLPVVSVGSGTGAVEAWLHANVGASVAAAGAHDGTQQRAQQRHGDDAAPDTASGGRLICVDPAPHSFQCAHASAPGRLPDYATCLELVDDGAAGVAAGRCLMMINWPPPSDRTSFDVDAIRLLRPVAVLLVVDTSGSAGTESMMAWLRSLPGIDAKHIEGDFKWTDTTRAPPPAMPAYAIASCAVKVTRDFLDSPIVNRYMLLVRSDVHWDARLVEGLSPPPSASSAATQRRRPCVFAAPPSRSGV